MRTKIQKWGNSYGVRIPMKIINKKNIFDGTIVEISEDGKRIIMDFPENKKESLESLVSSIKPSNLHSEQDWGNVEGTEVW